MEIKSYTIIELNPTFIETSNSTMELLTEVMRSFLMLRTMNTSDDQIVDKVASILFEDHFDLTALFASLS